jgi:hypothetical protein
VLLLIDKVFGDRVMKALTWAGGVGLAGIVIWSGVIGTVVTGIAILAGR